MTTRREAHQTQFRDTSFMTATPLAADDRHLPPKPSAEDVLAYLNSDDPARRIETSEPPEYTDAFAAVLHPADPWRARWVVAERDGVFTVRSLVLEPMTAETPAGGITADLLRSLSPSHVAQFVAAESDPSLDTWTADELRWRAAPTTAAEDKPPARQRGRPRLSDYELGQLALAYLTDLRSGKPGTIRRLAAQFDLPESTVKDRLRMCRRPDRQLLTPAVHGSRGGRPGERLLAMLGYPEPGEHRDQQLRWLSGDDLPDESGTS